MEQRQDLSSQKKPAGIEGCAGVFLKLCSWVWGAVAITGALIRISDYPLFSSLLLVLGVLMLPPIRRAIIKLSGFKVPHPVAPLAVGAGILAVILLQGNAERADQKAEWLRLAQIRKEKNQKDSTLIAAYPFVDRNALQVWQISAADSTSDSSKTFTAFIEGQQAAYKQRIADSIRLAQEMREYALVQERQWRRDSVNRAIEQRRAEREAARQQAMAVEPSIELDIDIERPKKYSSSKSRRGRKSSSGSSYSGSSGSSYRSSYSSSSGSRSSGGSGRRGGRRR